jgi:hypothetical protein
MMSNGVPGDDAGLKHSPVVTCIAAEIAAIMAEEGVTLEDLLAGLDEVGDEVYREHYGDPADSSARRD